MKEKIFGKPFTKKKKLAMILTPVCSLLLAGALITTAVLLRRDDGGISLDGKPSIENPDENKPSDSTNQTDPKEDKTDASDPNDTDVGKTEDKTDGEVTPPVSGTVTSFADPLKQMNILHTFGFYYNATLNTYYEHSGVDISAEAGDEVYATMDGTISAIYTGDVLLGNSVSLDNGEGIVAMYYYIDPAETLKVGDKVGKGDLLGTVSAPTGNEYKDGAHLHMEVFVNGVLTDPENYFEATEK